MIETIDDDLVHADMLIDSEAYRNLDVRRVKPPKSPDININEWMDRLTGQNKDQKREELQRHLEQFDKDEMYALLHKWRFWARRNQLAPVLKNPWTFWLLLAGRGFGKTRTGAEWVNERVQSGKAKRIALVAPTAADVRKVMVEGESGILAISPPWNRPLFEPSKLQLTWPNGAVAGLFSAEEPERLRGPQCDTFWADELCAWKKLTETWDMLQFGFRLGDEPQGCITTTPKPLPILKELIGLEKTGESVVTRGSTYDNKGNLAAKFFQTVVRKYEGSRLGRQELEAEILDDMPGALWKRSDIDKKRVPAPIAMPSILRKPDIPGDDMSLEDPVLLRSIAKTLSDCVPEDLSIVVVGVDPNASNDEGSDEIGIVVGARGVSGHGYILADLSMSGSPNEWATTTVIAHDVFAGDRVIGEANQGGNMVEQTITSAAKFLRMEGKRKSDFIPVVLVHATRGKVTRAEPVAALYEQGRVSHVGTMKVLEDQMCLMTLDFDRKAMGYSPDRVDALVWVLTHLFLEENDTGLLDFAREEAMKRKLALLGQQTSADPIEGKVRMSVPSNINTVYGRSGQQYHIENGFAFVNGEDVGVLRAAGLVEA